MGVFESSPKRVTSADAPPAFPPATLSVQDNAAAKRAAQARAPEVATALGLDRLEALQVRTVHVYAEGSVYTDETVNIKYDHTYAGLPVVPGLIGIGLTRSGEIRTARVYPTDAVAVASTTPAVSAEEAAQVAVAMTDWDEAVGRIPTHTGQRLRREDYPRGTLVVWDQPELVIFIPSVRHHSAQGGGGSTASQLWPGAPQSPMKDSSPRRCSSTPRPRVSLTGVHF